MYEEVSYVYAVIIPRANEGKVRNRKSLLISFGSRSEDPKDHADPVTGARSGTGLYAQYTCT